MIPAPNSITPGSWLVRRASARASFFTAATSRKNSRIGFAGAPPQRSPAGMSVITPAAAATCAPAPIFRWPAMPAWPPSAAKSPITLDPDTPDCDTSTA